MQCTTTGTPLVDAALQMSVKGWAVIPWHDTSAGRCSCLRQEQCSSPGKHPRLKAWQEQGTTDPDQIVRWWKQWPDANVGIVTGTPSGVFVLDFDVRSGGEATLSELGNEYPEIYTTYTVRTGGGGWHLYFQNPEGGVKSDSGVLPGMDVKGNGGAVIGPGSVHKSGGVYRVESDVPVRQCPGGLLDRIKSGHKRDTRWTQEKLKQPEALVSLLCPRADFEGFSEPVSDGGRKTQITWESISSTQQQQIDRAIKLSLPQQAGTRNRHAFNFARRLQSVEGFEQTTDPETLRLIVKRFHEAMMTAAQKHGFDIRGSFVDTFNDVRFAWNKIRTPADRVMSGILERVSDAFRDNAIPDPVRDCLDALGYDDDRDTTLLVALCWYLQQNWKGQGFPLSARAGESALRQLGASDAATFQWVNRRLIQLERDRVIRCTRRSKPGQRNIASEYAWGWSVPESV